MWPLSDSYIQAKNRLGDSNPWVILVELVIDDPASILRVAANASKDIIWNGQTWLALPLDIDTINETKEEVPQLNIRVYNADQMVQAEMEAYDGAVDGEAKFYQVYLGDLTETQNIKTFEFDVINAKATHEVATFTLGIDPSPYDILDPPDTILKNFCRYQYPNSKDSRCPYTGSLVTFPICNRTLANCLERNGDLAYRFGAFPAIGRNKLYVD